MSVTGENEMGLRKILDITRFSSIIILLLHFYFYLYSAFKEFGFTTIITDRLLKNTANTGLFNNLYTSKLLALALLFISIMGAKGKKNEKLNSKTIVIYMASGLFFYFSSQLIFELNAKDQIIALAYIVSTGIGYLLFLTGGSYLSRLIQVKLSKDVFNSLNETFPARRKKDCK
jgi:hypothetical protein